MRFCASLAGLVLFFILGAPAAAPGSATEAPGTLDLKTALRLAYKANPNLQISRFQELIAGEDVVRARSGFLPKVSSC